MSRAAGTVLWFSCLIQCLKNEATLLCWCVNLFIHPFFHHVTKCSIKFPKHMKRNRPNIVQGLSMPFFVFFSCISSPSMSYFVHALWCLLFIFKCFDYCFISIAVTRYIADLKSWFFLYLFKWQVLIALVLKLYVSFMGSGSFITKEALWCRNPT